MLQMNVLPPFSLLTIKKRGGIMIENFEDKFIINFRVAGYANKDALSN
jgi:hypothetical protein